MEFLGFNDLFRIGEVEILAQQRALTRSVVEREVTDANALVACSAAMADSTIGQLIAVEAASFIDSASGNALDRLIRDRYGLIRKAASTALGIVQFSTAATNTLAFVIPKGTVVGTQSGNQYITIIDIVFPAGVVGPISVGIQSILAGASQQALPNFITSVLSNIFNAPGDLTVNNALATAGANDVEPDDVFRQRARGFYATVRRGTLAAVQQAGLNAPGVRSATAIELTDANGYPGRLVQLFVTDEYTDALATLSVASPSYAIQSQQFARTVFDSLADWRPAGTYVQVIVAQVILKPIHMILAYQAGFDQTIVEQTARAAVTQYTQSLQPGQTWIWLNAQNALKQVAGISYTGKEIISPNGNEVPTPLQCIRTTMALVSASGNGD